MGNVEKSGCGCNLRDEAGNTLILTVLSMVLLTGFAGLAIDVSLASHVKRQLQTAADAAAVAAAIDYHRGDSDPQQAAKNATAANGITDGSNGASVTVNCPPTSGDYSASGACNGYFEAVAAEPSPANFMSLFGYSDIGVSARAVAGLSGAGGCVYAVRTGSSVTGISLSGSTQISTPDCATYDNANLSITGGGSLTAQSINVVGSTPSCGVGSTGCMSTWPTLISAYTDPLAWVQPPTVPSSCSATISTSGTYGTPGNPDAVNCYASITVAGGVNVNLNPGIYIVTGNFTVSGSGQVSGNGVTFYMAGSNSQVAFSGNAGSTGLSAPDENCGCSYPGLLFFQDRSDSKTFTFTGASGGQIKGIIYAPDAQLNFSGGSSANPFTLALVGGTLDITGNAYLGNFAVNFPGSVLGRVEMVE